MKKINVYEYVFEIDGVCVKVFDTSLNEYVGSFTTPDEVTEEKCINWLDEFYGWDK